MLQKTNKPKLPRKRKKACIKCQGRKLYLNTIKLAKITGEYPCKFWVNSSVVYSHSLIDGKIIPSITATKFW